MFHIHENRKDGQQSRYVVAPPGYSFYREHGKVMPEPKGFKAHGPEWGAWENRYLFNSHRAAARVANMCPGALIISEA